MVPFYKQQFKHQTMELGPARVAISSSEKCQQLGFPTYGLVWHFKQENLGLNPLEFRVPPLSQTNMIGHV
jgi:hypothetical protein